MEKEKLSVGAGMGGMSWGGSYHVVGGATTAYTPTCLLSSTLGYSLCLYSDTLAKCSLCLCTLLL